MDFSSVCRTCLGDQNLNKIFLDLKCYESYSRVIYLTAGVKVSHKDGLPQNMCSNCIKQLNNCLKFRKRCIRVETQLLNIKLNAQQKLQDESCKSKLDNEFNIDKIDMETENVEIFKTESDLEFDLDKNELFISKSLSQDSFESDSDELPLKYFVELVKNESEQVVLMDEGSKASDSRKSKECKANGVSCQFCQKVLSNRSIKKHIATCHTGVDNSKEKCDFCNKYILKRRMNKHRFLHQVTTDKALGCSYCKSKFDNEDVLVDHVKICTAKKKRKPRKYGREISECDICHKKMQKASLKMHKAVKHAGLGPVCEHCGRSFGNKLRLTEHYRAKHGYDKLRCTYCDFHTASVMSLKNHERRHRGEKPFVCETCGAKFHAAYLLSQHKQSHRTQKLIKCDLCPASFKTNNSLHMHRMTCHSSDLYKCTICSRAYSCRLYALKHIRHVHQYKGPVPALQRVENADRK